ncbi:MAG: hypothetical protein HQM12_04590 [SAR324 cluster bacterium]|nr:hypothetical protein [SAR324 cluster bacterium]
MLGSHHFFGGTPHIDVNAKDAALALGYQFERETLYERINQRTLLMMDAGWIEEVEFLLERYSPELKPLKAIGYLQIAQYLSGKLTRDAMVEQIQQKTRNFAKRQVTWFRKEPDIHWFAKGQESLILDSIRRFRQKD